MEDLLYGEGVRVIAGFYKDSEGIVVEEAGRMMRGQYVVEVTKFCGNCWRETKATIPGKYLEKI